MTTEGSDSAPLRVVIAGGGVAGLEALLALRDLAADRVELTLVAPQGHFHYRPLAVAEPFSVGRGRSTPLADAARETGATLVDASVEAVDPAARTVRTSEGTLGYDALLLALGARTVPAYARALTWDDRSDPEAMGGLLSDIEAGYTGRLAVVIPPGPGWPLPAYELALLIAHEARGSGVELDATLVTPEAAPLAAFGPRAVEAVTAELDDAGVRVEAGAEAQVEPGHPTTVVLGPSGRRLEVDRVVALPRLEGRRVDGIAADAEGFVAVDEHCRVCGLDGVWAAGDGIAFAIKQGGLAAQQADAAAEDIARLAGAAVDPQPFHPVLRGRLLTGLGRPDRWLRYDPGGPEAEGEVAPRALWWPPNKIGGRYLAPWLAARDEEATAGPIPHQGGLAVQKDLPHGITPGPSAAED
jgi:sulfide:quinone oxidoreductase